MRIRIHLVVWEMVLLLSSILVFRSVWTCLDHIEWAGRTVGLSTFFVVGVLLSTWSLHAISRASGGK